MLFNSGGSGAVWAPLLSRLPIGHGWMGWGLPPLAMLCGCCGASLGFGSRVVVARGRGGMLLLLPQLLDPGLA